MLKLFQRSKVDPKKQLQKTLGNFELPSFPAAILETLKILRDPKAELDQVSKALETDPGLVVKLLKTVNSAAFGLVREVGNVAHAVNMMGRSRVEALVLALATKDLLPREEQAGYEVGRFWRAAARRATLARPLAQRLHPATATESFTAALLQDMAVPVLATSLPKRYGPVLETWQDDPASSLEALENQAFGWDHTDIGVLMARHWGLPATLGHAIGGHHGEEEEGPVEPAITLVGFIRETEDHPGTDRLIETAHSKHGLPEEEVEELVDHAFDQASELARLLQ